METKRIPGSNGEVLAPFGKEGIFIKGKRFCIIVTGKSDDPSTPDLVKDALFGLPIDVVFTGEQVIEQCDKEISDGIPAGSVLAYAEEIIFVLESINRREAALALKNIAPNHLDMYVFEQGTYRIVD